MSHVFQWGIFSFLLKVSHNSSRFRFAHNDVWKCRGSLCLLASLSCHLEQIVNTLCSSRLSGDCLRMQKVFRVRECPGELEKCDLRLSEVASSCRLYLVGEQCWTELCAHWFMAADLPVPDGVMWKSLRQRTHLPAALLVLNLVLCWLVVRVCNGSQCWLPCSV